MLLPIKAAIGTAMATAAFLITTESIKAAGIGKQDGYNTGKHFREVICKEVDLRLKPYSWDTCSLKAEAYPVGYHVENASCYIDAKAYQ
jgi:hypothetical protein